MVQALHEPSACAEHKGRWTYHNGHHFYSYVHVAGHPTPRALLKQTSQNNSGRDIVDYALYKAISQVQVKSPFSNNTCSEAKKNALTQRRRLSSRCCCPIHHSCSRRAKKGSLIAHRSSSRAGLGQDCFSNLAFRCVGHVELDHGLLIGACGFPWMAAPRGRRLFDTYFSCLHNSVPLLIGSKQRTAFTSFGHDEGIRRMKREAEG